MPIRCSCSRHLRSGTLFAAISRWASALDGLVRDFFQDPRFTAIVEQDRREGQHRNPTERLDYFTTAYFHRPDELRAAVAGAGAGARPARQLHLRIRLRGAANLPGYPRARSSLGPSGAPDHCTGAGFSS